MARLDAPEPLTLLRAPAGFGKTTLVAQWVADQDRAEGSTAWLRVRRGAGDGASFWNDALEVLQDAGLAIPPRVSWPEKAERMADVAERALLEAESPVRLVIDGFDHVTDKHLDRALLDMLRYAPQLRLIVCVRGHQHFPAHRYLDVDTTLLTARDLRFTIEESMELLALAGVVLPESSGQALYDEFAGWPEPTRAFALHLRESPTTDPGDFAGMANRLTTDYLRYRLLPATQHPDKLELALLTSVPEDFSANVATLLTDESEVTALLDAMVAEGLLAAEIREGKPIYRWPVPARRVLQVELSRRWPDRLPDLHARLARWYLDDEQALRALHHAVQAQRWDLAVEVIDAFWRDLVFIEDKWVFEAFVDMPMEILATSPRALALRDMRLQMPDDRLLAVATLPDTTDELMALGASDEAADLLDTGLAVLIALRTRGSFAVASRYGAQLLEIAAAARAERPGDVVALYPSVHLHTGITQMLSGDLPSAQQSLEEAHRRGDDDPRDYVAADAAGKLALAHALCGDVQQAAIWIERQATAPLANTWCGRRIGVTVTTARLLLALDRLDLDAASAASDVLLSHTHREELWAYIAFAQALHALHVGTASDMLDRLARSRGSHRDWLRHGAAAGALLTAVEGAQLLALGRGNHARAVFYGALERHPLLRVGQARLALLSGQDHAALRLATDTGWDATAIPRHRHEMLLIRALAAHRLDDLCVAEEALQRAVDIARATGSLGAFTTVPRDRLSQLAERLPAAANLLAEEPLATSPDLYPAEVTLIQLTEREQYVLEGLAAGLTAQQIADQAVVTYNTIRTQQRSLYRKLGTSDRAEAVGRARQWGLLQADR